MKYLIVINNLGIGGAERLVVDDINEMLSRGLDVTLVTLKPEKESKTLSLQCNIKKEKWFCINFKNIYDMFAYYRFFKLIKSYNPDVVYTHLWFANSVTRICSYFLNIKNIISFEHNVYDWVKNRRMYFLDRLLQVRSRHIIAVSNAVKNSLIKNGILDKKIKVIINGIDMKPYKIKYDYDIKKDLGIPNEDFVFLFIGRLIHQKGVDILLESFSKFKKGSLVLVGDGILKQSLIEKALQLDIQDRVHFLGNRQDVPKILSSADCFVLPSRYEGLGIVVIEAMSAGKPIILSNFTATEDLVINGKNAIVVEVEDRTALSEAMLSVLNNDNIRELLSKEARDHSELFSIDKHVDNILSLIN